MSFKLEIISPQDKIFDDEVDLCIMPGIEGDFGVLRNHMPFLTTLRLGIAYIYKEKKLIKTYLVNGGVVEVSKNHCTLLTEDIINSNDFKDITGFLRNVSKKASKKILEIYNHSFDVKKKLDDGLKDTLNWIEANIDTLVKSSWSYEHKT